MADREKVIRAVETCFDSWIDKNRNMGLDLHEVYRLKREALELLKEQEAVKPRVSTVEQRCGNCNKVIEMDGWKACPWCGKPILWEGR